MSLHQNQELMLNKNRKEINMTKKDKVFKEVKQNKDEKIKNAKKYEALGMTVMYFPQPKKDKG